MSTMFGFYRLFRSWGNERWAAAWAAVRMSHAAWVLDRYYRCEEDA